MKNILLTVIIGASLCFSIENQSIDTSMTGSSNIHTMKYEEPVFIGPYFELASLSKKNITYDFKIMNRPYDAEFDFSDFYGLSGTLPINSWVGLYAIGAYQYVEVKYKDRNPKEGYANLENLLDENPFLTLDSSAIDGSFDIHHFTFQLGFDAGISILSSYEYQSMLKLYGFIGAIAGRAIYRKTDFTNTSIWGYSWGIGLRGSIQRVAASVGFRSSNLYSRTYFEAPSISNKNDDTFMMDPDFSGELFFAISYSLH